MSRSKILFVLHYPPPVHGSSVIGLQIKESETINTAYDCRYVNLGTSKTIDEIGKNPLGKLIRYVSILWQVLHNLIAHRPDLCYFAITAKGTAFYKDALVVMMIKLFRVRLVYHFHNKGVSTRQDRLLDNLLYQLVFKKADVILLASQLYPDIQKYVSLHAVHYCPNGIKQSVNIDRHEITGDCIGILFLSNMLEAKGVYILLDACKILKQRGVSFHCTFIGGRGDVTETSFQDRVTADQLSTHVTYAGKKLGKEKDAFLAKAGIFAFPTYYDKECFPLVLLEAMQAGLPVISTYEGGIPDIVVDGKTGFLIPQKDANALAERLELLIQNRSLRVQMGENGRIRYGQNYTIGHFELNLTTILNKCLLKDT